jgi:hypothetical protein
MTNLGSVSVIVEEKLAILLGRDGTVESIDVKGELTLAISQPELCKLSLRLAPIDQKTYKCSVCAPSCWLVGLPAPAKTHPNINKQTFTADSSLVLKDPSKGFPPNMPLGLLKWRFTSKVYPLLFFSLCMRYSHRPCLHGLY